MGVDRQTPPAATVDRTPTEPCPQPAPHKEHEWGHATRRNWCPGVLPPHKDGHAICRRCLFEIGHVPVEIEDEFLERCPECGAYDWTPEPVKP